MTMNKIQLNDTSPRRISRKTGEVKEFHLFAGIGGGIYGGELLGHKCVGAVEINQYCLSVLQQRQKDGWMNKFDIFEDIRQINGTQFKGTFDVLCGGFPCQAFSHAARGKNISEKNLWPEMFRFSKESEAPIVFGENVTREAIEAAVKDLQSIGYEVKYCRLSCEELGADHSRVRYWFLAVNNKQTLDKIVKRLSTRPKLKATCWQENPNNIEYPTWVEFRAPQFLGVGNAQSPFAAAAAFRILVNRHLSQMKNKVHASKEEVEAVFDIQTTWIKEEYGKDFFVHTPTTMYNFHYPSMQKHPVCRNFVRVFGRAYPLNFEYLMGFPIGASSPNPLTKDNYEKWISQ